MYISRVLSIGIAIAILAFGSLPIHSQTPQSTTQNCEVDFGYEMSPDGAVAPGEKVNITMTYDTPCQERYEDIAVMVGVSLGPGWLGEDRKDEIQNSVVNLVEELLELEPTPLVQVRLYNLRQKNLTCSDNFTQELSDFDFNRCFTLARRRADDADFQGFFRAVSNDFRQKLDDPENTHKVFVLYLNELDEGRNCPRTSSLSDVIIAPVTTGEYVDIGCLHEIATDSRRDPDDGRTLQIQGSEPMNDSVSFHVEDIEEAFYREFLWHLHMKGQMHHFFEFVVGSSNFHPVVVNRTNEIEWNWSGGRSIEILGPYTNTFSVQVSEDAAPGAYPLFTEPNDEYLRVFTSFGNPYMDLSGMTITVGSPTETPVPEPTATATIPITATSTPSDEPATPTPTTTAIGPQTMTPELVLEDVFLPALRNN